MMSVLESDLNRNLSSYHASHLSELISDLVLKPLSDYRGDGIFHLVILLDR